MKHNQLLIKQIVLSTLILLISANIFATDYLDLNPQATFWGFTGDNTLGIAQSIFPLLQKNAQNFYTIGEIYDAEGGNLIAGAGFGYRTLSNNNSRILGGYFIGDYNKNSNRNFWVLNPGIESLGELWDFRVNGYVPLGDRTKKIGEDFYSNIGNYDYVRFQGHSEYDARYEEIDQSGYGADFEIGRAIPKIYDLKIYAGGYLFGKYDGSQNYIEGVDARINIPLGEHFAAEVRDSYDNNLHNTFLIGLKVRLGNFSKNEEHHYGITTRLMDPIEHNSPAVLSANFSNAITKKTFAFVNSSATNSPFPGTDLVFDHIWYFRSLNSLDDTIGDGTYEHPYIGIDATKIVHILCNPKGQGLVWLYFAPGYYDFKGFTNNRMSIPEDFSMFGRTSDYQSAANGDERAAFWGGINIISGGNTFDSIRLLNDGTQSYGIGALGNNVDDLIFNNVDVGVAEEPERLFDKAMFFDNATIENISIGSITNSHFQGNDFAAQLLAKDNVHIDNISSSTFRSANSKIRSQDFGLDIESGALNGKASLISIGDITNSEFDGLELKSFSANNISGTINLGDISNSKFAGRGLFIDSEGLTSSGDISVGNISQSEFNSMLVISQSNSGNSGNINIGNISDSTFSGTGSTVGLGVISSVSSTKDDVAGLISIGNISNSKFNGGLYGLDAESYAVFGVANNVTIGNIVNDNFTGAQSGLFASSHTNRFFSGISSGDVSIGNITDSRFVGGDGLIISSDAYSGKAGSVSIKDISGANFISDSSADFLLGEGLEARSYSNSGMLGNVNIGNISNSEFVGSNHSGLYALSTSYTNTYNNGTINIGSIDNSTFTGTVAGIHLIGSAINIGVDGFGIINSNFNYAMNGIIATVKPSIGNNADWLDNAQNHFYQNGKEVKDNSRANWLSGNIIDDFFAFDNL